MSNLHKCEACGGVYRDPQRDGSRYFHVCPPVENEAYQPDISQADYDARTHVPREDARDENIAPGVEVHEGEYVTVRSDPNDSAKQLATPVDSPQKLPGAGRVVVGK